MAYRSDEVSGHGRVGYIELNHMPLVHPISLSIYL